MAERQSGRPRGLRPERSLQRSQQVDPGCTPEGERRTHDGKMVEKKLHGRESGKHQVRRLRDRGGTSRECRAGPGIAPIANTLRLSQLGPRRPTGSTLEAGRQHTSMTTSAGEQDRLLKRILRRSKKTSRVLKAGPREQVPASRQRKPS